MKTRAAWANACDAILRNDAHTRGIVVLGLDAPAEELEASLAIAAEFDLVKGFAVGRTIFGDAARKWLNGLISDEEAIADMVTRYRGLCNVWDGVRTF
jgi:5-dehydro-2-deoxygluconokinase